VTVLLTVNHINNDGQQATTIIEDDVGSGEKVEDNAGARYEPQVRFFSFFFFFFFLLIFAGLKLHNPHTPTPAATSPASHHLSDRLPRHEPKVEPDAGCHVASPLDPTTPP
jgi:hypothetical protein